MKREQIAKQSGICTIKAGELKHLKRIATRAERRKAKQNPECIPEYKKYHGYIT